MDVIKQWVLCLIMSAVCATLVSLISPRGSADRTLKTVVGIFVIAAVCSPLAELKKDDFDFGAVDGFEEFEPEFQGHDELYVEAFKTLIDSQVKTAAQECGIDGYTLESEMFLDENGCIIIQKIAVSAAESSQIKLNEFSNILEQRLGVAVNVTGEKDGTQIEAG